MMTEWLLAIAYHACKWKLAVLLQSSTLVTAICGVKSSQYSNF